MQLRTARLHAAIVTLYTAALPAAAAEPAATLETIVITGERARSDLEAEQALTPGAVTILDGAEFNQRRVSQLQDMLRYVPGIYAESHNGNDDVFYSSRGSNLDATDYDKNGIKFLQDGLPVSAADGNNHNRALDPMSARFAAVAHGTNALAYGASTLGGAIDFTTPTAHTTAPSIAFTGGSFGDRGIRATVGGVSGALDGLVTVETQQRDGYRDHSAQDRRGLYANVGWETSDNISTRFYATYVDYDAELPRELSPEQYRANPRQARADAIAGDHGKQVESWRLASKTSITDVAGGTLEFGLSHERQTLYHPIVSTPFFSLLIDTDHADSGAMLRYRRAAGSHDLLFGLNYGYSTVTGGNHVNDGGKPGPLMWSTDNTADSLELFALDRWNFAQRWTLAYGAQFISAGRNVGGIEGNYDAVNPRIGVIRHLAGNAEWYANLSRVYEAPTTFELTDDLNGGNTPLDAMRGTVVEVGMRGTHERDTTRLNWDVSLYHTALRDEILSRDDPDAPGTSLSANIDKTTHAGIESLLGASFAIADGGHRIEPLLNATFNAFAFDSDTVYGDNRLPAAPRYFVRAEVMYRNAAGFSIGPTLDWVGARYTDFANTYEVDSYTLFGMRASLTASHWELFAEARNLGNDRYVATVLVKDRATPESGMLHPGAPRSYYVGARYQF